VLERQEERMLRRHARGTVYDRRNEAGASRRTAWPTESEASCEPAIIGRGESQSLGVAARG